MNENEVKGNIVVIAPKVRLTTVFHYTGIEDIPNLVRFVGRPPVINLDMSLQYKKTIITPGNYIEVNSFGEVVKVITPEDLAKFYEVREVSEWNEQNANKVQNKPPRVSGKKEPDKKGKK
jgi:hypothetical protein